MNNFVESRFIVIQTQLDWLHKALSNIELDII